MSQASVLEEIVANRKKFFTKLFSKERLKQLEEKLAEIEKPRPFYSSLTSSKEWSLIAEIKARSPSRGTLMSEVDPVGWAKRYEGCGASALSVVTEENYFGGKTEWIAQVKKSSRLPVLRKDFLTTEEDLLESRALGADAVLLIAAILERRILRTLVNEVLRYGMEPLVEVHDEEDVEKALYTGTRMIGINNRNLHDFSVDIATTKDLVPLLSGRTVVTESGIFSSTDVKDLHACGVSIFLVGEAFLTAKNPEQKIAELLGRVCLSKPPEES